MRSCEKLLGWHCLLFSREGGGRLSGKEANAAKRPMADGSGLSCAKPCFSCERSGRVLAI